MRVRHRLAWYSFAMIIWGAATSVLTAYSALAAPEIPDPPSDPVHLESNWWERRNIDSRVLEPCDLEKWTQETVNRDEMVGILQHKPWTKSAESYEAGGSDYFILCLDDLGEERFFPRVIDESVRQSMLAVAGQRVHLYGRWAPYVRYSETQQIEIDEAWNQSQHPIDLEGNIPDPPTTWGGKFVVDCVDLFTPPLSRSPDLRYHSTKSIVSWTASATLAAEIRGTLRCEDLGEDPGYPGHRLSRFFIESNDGERVVLRPGLHGNPALFRDLINSHVCATGRWAKLIVRPKDDKELAYYGPVLKAHPTDDSLVVVGGGVFVDQILPAPEMATQAQKMTPKP